MPRNRRRKVDPVKQRAGKLGVLESTKRRRHDRNVVILLRQKYPNVLRQIEAILPRQNSAVDQAIIGVPDPVKADSGAVDMGTKRPRKTPERGGRGGTFLPTKTVSYETTDENKKNSRTKKTGRVRNEIWDTVCEVYAFKPVTKNEQSRVGKIVRDLKLKEATPDDIRTRSRHYRQRWPKMSFTPEALLKHWDSLEEPDHAGGSRVKAKPGKYDNLETIDLCGPDPQVLPGETEATDLADADQGPRMEPDRPAAPCDNDIHF